MMREFKLKRRPLADQAFVLPGEVQKAIREEFDVKVKEMLSC